MRRRPLCVRLLFVATFSSLLAGCIAIGPRMVQRDRLDYGRAMGETMKEQMLLNIVKSRYLDWPTFLDVGQIVAGYSLEHTASLTGEWFPKSSSTNLVEPSVGGVFTEAPTITYSPLDGSSFTTTLLEPLDLDSILAVAYSGWKADRLFELTLNSLNGLRNEQFVGDTLKPADADFLRVLELFRDLQTANAWGLTRRTKQSTPQAAKEGTSPQADKEATTTTVSLKLSFRVPEGDRGLEAKITELKRLLKLDATQDTFDVVYGDSHSAGGVLAIESRTLWETFWDLQRFVEVPPEDLAAGRAERLPTTQAGRIPLLRVHSGDRPPPHAFVAVPYRQRWYWIDDGDLESKHTVSVILLMFTLARTSGSTPPQLVIPTR